MTIPASALIAGVTPLWVDCDCCVSADGPVSTPDEWRRVLERDSVAGVDGAFAVAWTTPDGTVRLARDPIGERTLYYAVHGGELVFAPTMRALLSSASLPRRLDLDGVAAYLGYAYVPGRRTLVEGVSEVLPGEIVSFDGVRIRRERFWEPPAEDPDARPEDEYVAELRDLLEDAVGRRLPPEGPLVASLSGGVDSSLVVALARALDDRPLVTYSLSFGPEFPNELEFSALVASRCGAEHRVIELEPERMLVNLDVAMAGLGKPIGDPLTVPNLVLFREAAGESHVVLNGEGGDPSFGGPKNVPMLLAELYGETRRTARRRRERAYLRAHRKCYADLPAMLGRDVAAATAARLESELTAPLHDPARPMLVSRLMALNVASKGAHHILPKLAQLSAPCGVRARSPLFDRSVVEAALRMPAGLRLRGTVEKHVLKRAVDDLLPPEVIERPKSGMRVPVEGWMTGRYERLARERLLDGLGRHGIVRRSYLEALAKGDPAFYGRGRGAKTWLLLSLEAWLRTVFEAVPDT
jgi:asparagine synthase (glutamine-hydrolysing)